MSWADAEQVAEASAAAAYMHHAHGARARYVQQPVRAASHNVGACDGEGRRIYKLNQWDAGAVL